MRVIINGLSALKPKTGVGHHVAELAHALQQLNGEDAFTLYPGSYFSRQIRAVQGGAKKPANASKPKPRARWKGWLGSTAKAMAKLSSSVHFTAYTKGFPFELYHEPNFLPFRTSLPTIVTVHDLSVLKFPQWHPQDRVRHHHKHFLRGLNRAQHVIVVSDSVRRELVEELNCPTSRVSTVHNGIGSQFVPQRVEAIQQMRRVLNLPEQYFLCVGTIEPRKNLGTVIRAFADLPAEIRTRCPLVLAGPWGWRAEQDRDIYERIGEPAGVRYLGYTQAEYLPALYAGARVLLYPSHYEGFGMPPTEMLACGGAVIASTADSLREVLANHALFIEAEDVPAWRDTLLRIANDNDLLNSLKQGGIAYAQRFSWERAARETRAVYDRVLYGTPAIPEPSLSRSAA